MPSPEHSCLRCPDFAFDCGSAGKNATMYGPGAYFARNASYSARDTYSPKDTLGHKRVFLFLCLPSRDSTMGTH